MVVVVVGLARDGCLVRSWGWGHAVGLAVERKRGAREAVRVEEGNKPYHHSTARDKAILTNFKTKICASLILFTTIEHR